MKIWKIAESSDNRHYGQQENWSKHKASDFDAPGLPSSMKQLYSRFDNSLVYREVDSIGTSQACVYFLYLPNDTYKIGETTVGNLHDRLGKPQTYFIDDVVLEGIQICESSSVARSLEQTLLDYFLGIEKPRREVLTDHGDLVECYIIEYCLSQKRSQKIMENGKRISQRSRQKK